MPYPFSGSDVAEPLHELLNDAVEAVNTQEQRGIGSKAVSGTGTPEVPAVGSDTVTFATAFPPGTTVIVATGVRGTTAVGNRFALPTGESETGFTIRVASNTGTNQTVSYWWTAAPATQ